MEKNSDQQKYRSAEWAMNMKTFAEKNSEQSLYDIGNLEKRKEKNQYKI